MKQLLRVQVAVTGPFFTPLDYWLEAKEEAIPVVGGRVWVPLRNKLVIGLVMHVAPLSDSELTERNLKAVDQVVDTQPLFDETQLAFLHWASRYYLEPIGDVVLTALPRRLRMGEQAAVVGQISWRLSEQGKTQTTEYLPKQARRQRAVFEQFLDAFSKGFLPLGAGFFAEQPSGWRDAIKKLTAQGWLEEVEGSCMPTRLFAPKPNHVLNDEQRDAVERVAVNVENGGEFAAFLLQGVTGSGKTEVYLGMIEAVLAQGKQALVLVPEIGLTPQMVSRFEAHLQTSVAVVHSGLNDTERHCAWHQIRTGEVQVLLGTRSAIFTPFQSLGLCIIDEEHDLSYKQQDGFRYSARDLLIQRAAMERVPVVLGSATPSLESLHNAQVGRYQFLFLPKRAGGATLPPLRLIDIRGERIEEGVARSMRAAMDSHLQAGGQVLLFLNRRGFAPVLMCHDCGWQAACPSCDANMTLHQGEFHAYLQCHHCAEQLVMPTCCPDCESTEFVKVGQGTERLEEAMTQWFPDRNIVRIDRDTTRQKGKMAELTQLAHSGEADILIGTQMLAKGHHFPNVTLVGILDVDQGLFSADFRAAERMAQQVLQVAGRAGRAEKRGEVFIQTHQPTHPLLLTLVKEGYDAFAKAALEDRSKAMLPPYQYQVLVRAEAHDPQDAMTFLQSLKMGLDLQQDDLSDDERLALWGPVPAPMLRRQGRYRYQLLLQATDRKHLHRLMRDMLPHMYKSPYGRKVRWSVDVDPQEMM